LGVAYSEIGQHDKAIAAARDAMAVEPSNGNCYANLMTGLLALGRLDESKVVYHQAVERKVDNLGVHFNAYYLGFLENDRAEMDRQVAWAGGKPGVEGFSLGLESETAASVVAKARELSHQSVRMAASAGGNETAAEAQLEMALYEAEIGTSHSARLPVSAWLEPTRFNMTLRMPAPPTRIFSASGRMPIPISRF
jgi:tetratricopeptide (TPR) repeat protein